MIADEKVSFMIGKNSNWIKDNFKTPSDDYILQKDDILMFSPMTTLKEMGFISGETFYIFVIKDFIPVEHNKFKLIYDIYDMEMDGNPSKVIWGNRGGMISPDYNNQVMLTKYHLVRGSYKVMKYMGDKRCLFINWMNKNPLGVKQ